MTSLSYFYKGYQFNVSTKCYTEKTALLLDFEEIYKNVALSSDVSEQ